jgi:hypothetical protein
MDQSLQDFVIVTEVDNGPAFADALFQRKYRLDVPDFPHHIVAFYRKGPDHFVPASYIHFTWCGDLYLVGGGCTDGRVFARMPEEHARAITAAGGLLLQVLRHGFRRYAAGCEAFFGVCGDPRAWEVCLQAGFSPTTTEHLLAYCPRPLDQPRLHELTCKARCFMPF